MSRFSAKVSVILMAMFLIAVAGCSKPIPRVDPTGKLFPEVQGTRLSGEEVVLPKELSGQATVALVGYVQEAQFDIDRWILGLLQMKTPTLIVEVPTIQGLVPSMIRGRIDGGMRKGIPQEDWNIVITVYEDAEKIAKFTGTENPNNARVFLLDTSGSVRWFADRGYSASQVMELDKVVRQLESADE